MRYPLLLAILIVISHSMFAQISPIEENNRIGVAALKSDFEILTTNLKAVHPSIYSFISEEHLNSLIATTSKNLTKDLTEVEFYVIVRQFIRDLRCGHTRASPSKEWDPEEIKDLRVLPFDVILLDNEIYIKKSYDEAALLLPGMEIVAIDGNPAKKIVEQIKSILSIDGYSKTYDKKRFEKYFESYYLYLYGNKESYEIEYADKNEKNSAKLKGRLFSIDKEPEAVTTQHDLKMSNSTFQILKDKKVAILDINNFSSNGYKKYYKAVFEKIEEEKIDNLVIDLRGNGGGYFPNGNRLLKYLLKEEFSMKFKRPQGKVKKESYLKMPFISGLSRWLIGLIPDRDKKDPQRNYAINYKPIKKNGYDGNLYVLIDGNTFSMASIVTTQLKLNTTCTIIGEETGGGESGTNGILMYNLTLPETKVDVWIPYYFVDQNAEVLEQGRGVIPDIEVTYDLNEILQKEDKEMKQVKLLAN